MIDLPPPDEFYAARDNRTDRVNNGTDYRSASILLVGETDVLETYSGRVMARTISNLLSRFVRDIDVAFSPVAPDTEVPPNAPTLGQQCLRRMADADPHGRFDTIRNPDGHTYDCRISIGNPNLDTCATPTIRIDGGGWRARVVRNVSVNKVSKPGNNPIGPAVAACLGGAEAFKTIVEMPPTSLADAFVYDTLHHQLNPNHMSETNPSLPSSIALGTVRMVGVGSVGSAATYFLRRLPGEATVQLIDYDNVEMVNLNRSPLFTAEDALAGVPKVKVASKFLADHVNVQPFDVDYMTFEDAEPTAPDLVLPLANERNVRSDIQYSRPPLQIHATTSQSDVAIRRSIPIDEPCLLCHFPPAEAPLDASCAEGPNLESNESDEEPDAAFPFASFLAGCFVAAELAKLPLDGYPFTKPVARVQTLTDLGSHWVPKGGTERNEDCPFCPEDSPEFHRKKIGETRFAHLTETEP